MRYPRLRFTVRRLMAFVSLCGIVMGGFIEIPRLRQLSHIYWVKSRRMAGREQMVRAGAAISRAAWVAQYQEAERVEREYTIGPPFSIAKPYPPERCVKLIPYYEALRRKYERAAAYPWLSIEPDPPPPN